MSDHPDSYHQTTYNDIITLRQYLLVHVPAELANLILDKAEYYAVASMNMRKDRGDFSIEASHRNQNNATATCLTTPALGQFLLDQYPDIEVLDHVEVRKIRFKITSHDQGWCGEPNVPNRYATSFTWFEARIVRSAEYTNICGPKSISRDAFDAIDPIEDDEKVEKLISDPKKFRDIGASFVMNSQRNPMEERWLVQRNVRAERQWTEHVVVWRDDESTIEEEDAQVDVTGTGLGTGFIRSLQMGDRIVVIARALYPAWANYIQSVDIEVYFSV